MPTVALTDLTIKNLKPVEGKRVTYLDKNVKGFGIRVAEQGQMSYVLTYGPNRARVKLGEVGILKLAEARTKARTILAERQLGVYQPRSQETYESAVGRFLEIAKSKNRPRAPSGIIPASSSGTASAWSAYRISPLARCRRNSMALPTYRPSRRTQPRCSKSSSPSVSAGTFSIRVPCFASRELKEVYGIPYCRMHVRRLELKGRFPQRVHLGECRVVWLAQEVEQWIQGRLTNGAHKANDA